MWWRVLAAEEVGDVLDRGVGVGHERGEGVA